MKPIGLLVILALFHPAAITAQTQLSEIRIDQPGADTDEYFEISGSPGFDLSHLAYVVVGDGAAGSGVIESVTSLAPLTVPPDGYLLGAEPSFALGPTPDLETSLNFENGDNVTHMLVADFSGTTGMDLDTNDDGILDSVPWSSVVDCIALLESEAAGDRVYCDHTVGPNGSVPWHVYRDGGWQVGENDPDVGVDTPGEPVSGLPVELQDFVAVVEPHAIAFRWTTLSERDNAGFRVYRRSDGHLETTPFIRATGSLTGASYATVLPKPPPGVHQYGLTQYDIDGSAKRISTVTVPLHAPRGLTVSGPYPNPAGGDVRLLLTSQHTSVVTAVLTDLLGRRGRQLYSGTLDRGENRSLFFSVAGSAPGQYFVTIQSENHLVTRPLTVVGSRR